MPGFYNQPETILDLVDHAVDRVLDLLGIPGQEARRWDGAAPEGLYDLKADLTGLLGELGAPVANLQLVQDGSPPWWRPGRAARLQLGLNSTTVGGQVVCVTAALGCVPVNPFGLGSITPAAAAFISPARSSSDLFERSVVGASLAGEFLSLPAGPISAALGVEYRDDRYEFMPGATDLAREYGTASRGITAGR